MIELLLRIDGVETSLQCRGKATVPEVATLMMEMKLLEKKFLEHIEARRTNPNALEDLKP